jgi:hypothetical protein
MGHLLAALWFLRPCKDKPKPCNHGSTKVKNHDLWAREHIEVCESCGAERVVRHIAEEWRTEAN